MFMAINATKAFKISSYGVAIGAFIPLSGMGTAFSSSLFGLAGSLILGFLGLQAGQAHGIRPVGGRALLSLRLEKGYGSWGREFSPEYWPHETGMARLIKADKPEFLNRDAWLAVSEIPARYQLVNFRVDTHNADASGGEAIFAPDGTPIGVVSSGSYGHATGVSLAMGVIKASHAEPGTGFDIAILGQSHGAELLAEPLFDPQGSRLRS